MNRFIIKAKLPSLNDYINVCRRNKYQAAQFKQDVEEVIGWAIKQALVKGELKPTDKTCEIIIDFYEKTKRRDVDNIQSSQKYILDAMVKQKIIPNDTQRYVRNIYHTINEGKTDYVVVNILPAYSVTLTIL